MRPLLVAALGLLVALTATIDASAKGNTTKIVMSGAGLQQPVEIGDRETLEPFNVWSGPGTFENGVEGREGFIVDWASEAATRPDGLPGFDVSFYVRYANRPFDQQPDQLAYVVSYAVDPATGQGFVFLPGKDDERYRLNTMSICHGREGHWFHATGAWQHAFNRFVAK